MMLQHCCYNAGSCHCMFSKAVYIFLNITNEITGEYYKTETPVVPCCRHPSVLSGFDKTGFEIIMSDEVITRKARFAQCCRITK